MTGPQLVTVWALLALAVVGVPAAAVAWWAGRRSLRAALDPGRLAPVDWSDVRLVVEGDTLPIAALFPTEPALLWSEWRAAGDNTEREIAEMIAAAERRIPWL